MSVASEWQGRDWERVRLGIRRYRNSWAAVFKYLILMPCVNPEATNEFARELGALKDDLGYRSTSIPAKDVWELFPGIEQVEIQMGRIFPDEGSSINLREMAILCSIVRHERARTMFEIGTSKGVTAFNLGLNLPEDGVLHTLDLPFASGENTIDTAYGVSISDRKMIFADRRQRRFNSSSVEPKVHEIFSDSATFDGSQYAKQCDIVFVDGAHSLKYVESDTKTAFQLVRPGGLVIWHDFNDGFFWPDVQKYLLTIASSYEIKRIKGTMFAVCRAC
jgi:predicted O-methyltransferase YrrM